MLYLRRDYCNRISNYWQCSLTELSEVFGLVVCRCRYLTSVSVLGIFVGIFYVGLVFGIGILKYRDIGIGIRYLAIIYNFWCNPATAMRVGSFHVHVGL